MDDESIIEINGKLLVNIQEVVEVLSKKTTLQRIDEAYPYILTANHISKILHVSSRKAYEIMEYKSFPLIRLGRSKRTKRDDFFKWLEEQKNGGEAT